MSLNRVHTPCIGVCSTTFGDTVCRGCKRFLHEIVDWNRYSDAQKMLVWQRLDLLLCTVVGNYLEVIDAARLSEQLTFQNIRQQPQLSPPGWVPELLKAAGHRVLLWEDFGLRYTSPETGLTPRQLYDRISAEVYALAEAHYDRNHRRPGMRLSLLLRDLSGDGSPDTQPQG